jgi:hypothetical protein
VFISLILDYLEDNTNINDNERKKFWINLNDIDSYNFLYDHRTIIKDYLMWRQNNSTFWSSKTR